MEGGTEQELVQVSEVSATPERCCGIISLLVVDWHGWKAERPARRGGEVPSAECEVMSTRLGGAESVERMGG